LFILPVTHDRYLVTVHFSAMDPRDLPAPTTTDEIAGRFTVPLMTLIGQAALEEVGAGTVSTGRAGGPTLIDSVSLSFTFWRNPADHDDPRN
jgi:hypothetical protein